MLYKEKGKHWLTIISHELSRLTGYWNRYSRSKDVVAQESVVEGEGAWRKFLEKGITMDQMEGYELQLRCLADWFEDTKASGESDDGSPHYEVLAKGSVDWERSRERNTRNARRNMARKIFFNLQWEGAKKHIFLFSVLDTVPLFFVFSFN
eukprot:Trichotokara_eunicae@DN8558_c0_g1_i1.p1